MRLKTSDFEFSVWAYDISDRAELYSRTVASRDSLQPRANQDLDETDVAFDFTIKHPEHHHLLRFAPAVEMVDVNILPCVCNEPGSLEQLSETTGSVANNVFSKKCDKLELSTPLFFENTQYQFEWVFFDKVKIARLVHRSKRVNEAFRFVPEVETVKGVTPARLTGTINTGNNVGWLRLPILFGSEDKSFCQHIAFEVLPTKIVLHQDLPTMYQAIDKVYPLWRFSLFEKTEQDVATCKQRGHFPLMWLANFATLRARLEQGLKVICAAPHSRLQSTPANVKAAKLKGHLPHRLAQKIKHDFTIGQFDNRYRVEKKLLSVDTSENRFIKMVVSQSKNQLAKFESKLRQNNQAPEHQYLSDDFLSELHSWQQPLQRVLRQSFLKEVRSCTGVSRESLVLQQKAGYSAVYSVWQELKFYLDVFGNQSSISMKSVAEIYEIWCFLCIKQILEEELGFEMVENNAAKLVQNDFFEYQMKDGFAGAFGFKRADGVMARLAHEPKFTKKGRSIRSYLINQEPDIYLEITLPSAGNLYEEKQFVWLFDAKYRIKTSKNRFDDNSEDIIANDYVPDDAINQMHRYRDALIRLSESRSIQLHAKDQPAKKSRPVFGAFALYPGFFDQKKVPNPYASAIEEVGIGAFALLPTQGLRNAKGGYCGYHWLLEFLQAQIGATPKAVAGTGGEEFYPLVGIAERLYANESARIPFYGMRQVLYPDLTMTLALAGQRGRVNSYFECFEQGTAQWYHIPQSTFLQKFKQHVAEEIRYLALASTSDIQSSTKKIDKVWPVKRVTLLPRHAISEVQAGKKSDSADLYYLFELGKQLMLQIPVTNVPHRPIRNSMKLTTLTSLESVSKFSEIERVYEGALK